jgi:hypothetical protein
VYGRLAPSVFKLAKQPGEWNKMKIIAKGKNIKVMLKREKITRMDMSLWISGKTNPDGKEL